MIFSLCSRVGWCDVCTDFTNVIKVDVDVNKMSLLNIYLYIVVYTFYENTFIIGNLISFICPVVWHFSESAVKYMLKTQKSQHFSF